MREYGVIQTSYWTDEKIVGLSTEAKLLGAYLLTCPHSNAIGCFRLPMGYVSEDLQWSPDAVHAALSELAAIQFICRDEASGWTFIRRFLEFNTIENPNVGKACVKMIDVVPASFPFFHLLIAALEPYEKRFPDGYLEALRGRVAKCAANRSANGSGNGSANGSGNGSGNPYANRMPNPEPNLTNPKSSVASATAPPAVPETPPASGGLKAQLFGSCLDWLATASGRSPQNLRPVIGRWIAAHGEGAALGAIVTAQREQAVSPVDFIEAVLKAGVRHGRKAHSDHNALINGLAGAFGDLLDTGPARAGGRCGQAAIRHH